MTNQNTVGLDGYSPVSYFENGPERGKEAFSTVHRNTTYYFTSAEQRGKFLASPEKYLPAFDGFCAFGHSIEKEFPVDPTSYKIANGRLFLFLKNAEVDALQLWNKGNQEELLAKAEKHFASAKK